MKFKKGDVLGMKINIEKDIYNHFKGENSLFIFNEYTDIVDEKKRCSMSLILMDRSKYPKMNRNFLDGWPIDWFEKLSNSEIKKRILYHQSLNIPSDKLIFYVQKG